MLRRPLLFVDMGGWEAGAGTDAYLEAPIVSKSTAGTSCLQAGGAHASTRACNARTSATSPAGALPVSAMRVVQVSIQRLSAWALKPRVWLASSTNTSWASMNSIACGQWGLLALVLGVSAAVVAVDAVMVFSFWRRW